MKSLSYVPTARPFFYGLFLLLGLALTTTAAVAHSTGENYVWINVVEDRLEGRFEVRLEDLRNKLGLELATVYDRASEQLLEASPQVEAYIRARFTIRAGGAEIPYEFTETKLLESNAFGHFAQFYYRTAPAAVPDVLQISNGLFFENDAFHRSLLLVEYDKRAGKAYGPESTALIFSPANDTQELDFNDIRGLLSNREFIWQGMLHIWIGIDHILFLVALLLPAVLVRKDRGWEPVANFRTAFWNTLKVVTVFTLAHSITLALAALEIVQLPSRLVESIIALSIILVALNNIFPKYRQGTLLIIFVFGLFHGLGFASVMGQLPFRMQDLIWVLIAFNVGVEIGQIAIVAVIVPLIYWMREQDFYQRVVPIYGSLVLATIAAYWLMERALGWSL